jgi:hypothetical protein
MPQRVERQFANNYTETEIFERRILPSEHSEATLFNADALSKVVP